jgi:hypothetical protein
MVQAGALDEAVVDVDGIIHVATALPREEETPDGLWIPIVFTYKKD